MFVTLLGASGLTLPTLHTHRPYFPLDTISLTLTRDAFDALGRSDGPRNLGLLCVPEDGDGSTEPPSGLCGVIAEISSCGVALDSDSVLVRGVAFTRFRVGEAAVTCTLCDACRDACRAARAWGARTSTLRAVRT